MSRCPVDRGAEEANPVVRRWEPVAREREELTWTNDELGLHINEGGWKKNGLWTGGAGQALVFCWRVPSNRGNN